MLADGELANSFLVRGATTSGETALVSGPAGMKRACCGSEARKIALNPSMRAEFLN